MLVIVITLLGFVKFVFELLPVGLLLFCSAAGAAANNPRFKLSFKMNSIYRRSGDYDDESEPGVEVSN